ncbi:hypothetical protein CEP54_014173 [Fusarium duplospermum]|uniref:Uncharacterized protein n=1 Tax=Fusarium duplospermum TaxID=1325734 RepID=A0A428NY49_9HYPO|nr:hypothetical protein CEP54_014173 [Fusarium duplospermum]
MDRVRLAENGIFIEDGDEGCELLPPHVESLQDALLDFRQIIPDRFGCTEDEILKLLDEDGINARDDIPDDDRAEIAADLEFCAGVRELTNHLVQVDQLWIDEYSEDDWKLQFEELLLDQWAEEAQVCDGDTRQAARTKFYYDSFQQARDRPWTLFGPDGSEGTQGDLPEPKPAWVAHFPVFVISPVDNRRHSGLQHFASSHSIVDNFSQVTLEHLASHGLQPSATGVKKTGRRGAALSPEHVLFPWLIAEHMKDEYKGNVELCYSQAANAGAAALRMLQNLSRHDIKFPDDTHIPPVVIITTRRDLVRVWIMHSAHSKGTFEMQVIWRGSLTRMVDIFELRAILENCHTWATRVLRPWISRQIDLWKQHCPDDCPRPFDASLRRRAAQSKNTSNRPIRNENAPEEESGKNENKDVDLRQIIREEHDRLLKQLSKAPVETPPIETKRPTRSIATQTGPASPDVDRHPLEKSAVRPTALNYTRNLPRRKILEAKPRHTKTIGSVGVLPSSDKGETAPAGARQETDSTQRQVSSVDLFKNTKKVFGEKHIFAIKLPDVSSEEILAQKPWLGARKSSEAAEKQTETALTQESEQAKDKVEKDKAGGDDDEKKADEATHDESEAEDESKEKSDNDRVDDKSDKLDEEQKSKEDKAVLPLTTAIEETDTRPISTTDDKEDPLKDTTEAASIPEKGKEKDLEPELVACSKPTSIHATETAENERSGEIAKEENPEESIENERTEEIPEKGSDEIIDKGDSENVVKEEEKANHGEITEEEKPKEPIEKISEESTKHENPKETTEKQDSSEGMINENSNQNPREIQVKLPQLTPEPEPADHLSPNPPERADILFWRQVFSKKKDDDHKESGKPTVKQSTPPPRDGPVNKPAADTPETPKAVKGMPSPPSETKTFAVFDATRWTHAKFAFGSPESSKEPPFTFKMKTEGSADDPRISSIPGSQAKDPSARLFKLLEPDDDGPALSENPRPSKLIKGGGVGRGQETDGWSEGELKILEASGFDLGPANKDSIWSGDVPVPRGTTRLFSLNEMAA